jgi:hypothetical protein
MPQSKTRLGSLVTVSAVLGAAPLASCDNRTPPPAPTPAPAPNPRIVYELREKCGKNAREWFEHNNIDENAAAAGILMNSDFTSHYNEHLNRCYAVSVQMGTIPSKTEGITMTLDKHLVEVVENKDMGRFFINSTLSAPKFCNVGDQTCASRDEWESLVAPYMSQ